MRLCIALTIVACAACKKTDSAKSTGSGSDGSGSAAVALADATPAVHAAADAGAPAAAFCLDADDVDAELSVIASDTHTITFCYARSKGYFSAVTQAEAPARTKCAVADFAAGTMKAAAPSPPPPEPAAEKPYDTSKLKLPKPDGDGELYAAPSPDGKLVAVTSESINGKLFIFDAATGAQKKVVSFGEADGGCMEKSHWIGNNIYAQYNVCAGPGATGWIVSPAGKKLGGVMAVNPTGTFFPAGGTRYAFEDFAGSAVEIVDGATGKSLQVIKLDCTDCFTFGPQAARLVQIGGGKLVQFGGKLVLVDPVAMKVEKAIDWPTCPEPKQ